MHTGRICFVFSMLLCLLALLQLRAFALAVSGLGAAAAGQGSACITLDTGRGDIFDRNMRPLTGVEAETLALAVPGQSAYERLSLLLQPQAAAQLYENAPAAPTLAALSPGDAAAADLAEIPTYTRPVRYFAQPAAVHILGYLDGEGKGAAGIEKSYEAVLAGAKGARSLYCSVTAFGGLVRDTQPVEQQTAGSGLGVRLTLDLAVQRICEGAAQNLSSGAVVVTEVSTGKVLGAASVPVFDPQNVAASIDRKDGALLCRPFCAFNVGSVFKPVAAACALQAGQDPAALYECTGAVTVAGHTYHCAKNKAHGPVDMKTALMESCTCYFVDLACRLGGERLAGFAAQCGFGRAVQLWDGYTGAPGSLPDENDLRSPGQAAALGFGQGKLLASPVQVAAFYAAAANGGIWRAPVLVEGVVRADTGEVITPGPVQESLRIMSEDTARTLRQMLAAVVEEGLGRTARTEHEKAVGKTGTAQTGRYDENGREELDAWFAGFWPADAPRYAVVVLEDSTRRTGEEMGAVFRQVCDELARLELWG